MATTSPPFGLCLFVMKGVAPIDTTIVDIYKAALPFLGLDLITMALIFIFPGLALWLPGMMS
jgi:TRAP-type mannitol/chloroaromatic compound transport system permease large subunit